MPGYIFIREIKDRNMAGKKKKRGRKKIVLFVFEILLLGVLLGVLWLYNTTLGQVDFDDDALSASEAGINEDIQSGCDCADYLTDDLPDIIDNLVNEMTEEQ